jgi:hypothetical protein
MQKAKRKVQNACPPNKFFGRRDKAKMQKEKMQREVPKSFLFDLSF